MSAVKEARELIKTAAGMLSPPALVADDPNSFIIHLMWSPYASRVWPLTTDQRERIRVKGIHRRGALRIH